MFIKAVGGGIKKIQAAKEEMKTNSQLVNSVECYTITVSLDWTQVPYMSITFECSWQR